MRSKSLTLALVGVLLLSPVVVGAASDPRFETYVPEPTLTPGATQSLSIQLVNDAENSTDRVRTARDVRVTVRGGDTPIEVHSGTRLVGSMPDGRVVPVTVQIEVPANAPGGTYRLPLSMSYVDPDEPDERLTKTVYATVRVPERPRFVVESVESSAPVGGSGTVTLEVTNVGERAASAAALSLASQSPDLRFNRAATASRFVGEWAPGETRRLSYEVTFAEGAEPRPYTLSAVVEYEENGSDRRSASMRVGVTPLPEQTFALGDVDSSLHVGEEGTIEGTVTNTGERVVENVVIRFESANPNVNPLEPEVALGRLKPGQSKEFVFDVEVSGAAEAGPRQFSFVLEYQDRGVTKRSDPLKRRVKVGARRDEFAVNPVRARFKPGESGQLVVEITNTGERPLREISAKLFADAPVSAGDDEAFVDTLGPGETATLTFGVSVGGEALEKSYPVKMDFRYETSEGETRISDTYQIPVRVVASGGGGVSPLAFVGAGLVVLAVGVGYFLYRRRGR